MEKPTEGKCVVCGSAIVERLGEELPPIELCIIGPGSKDQIKQVSYGYNCSNPKCGLKYAFIPKK